MKIGFVTDTNLLKKSQDSLYKDKKVLDTADIFIDYVKALNETDSKNKLIYIMPNIVLEELCEQKISAYNESYLAFTKKYNELSYGIVGELPKSNIEKIIEEEKQNYSSKVEVINLKYSESLFKEIVADSLKKKAPFNKECEGKKTDAGFKDALIWKTVLYADKIDECDALYFISSDKVFDENKEDLMKEFESFHPNTKLKIVYFKPDGNQRQNSLQQIIKENELFETKVVKLYNKDLINKFIHNINYNFQEEIKTYLDEREYTLLDIKFSEFTNDDYVICGITESDNKYKMYISFDTWKYDLNNKDIELNNLKKLSGIISLDIVFKNKKFEMEGYEIKKVEFPKSIFQILTEIKEGFGKLGLNAFQKLSESINIKNIINDIKIEPNAFELLNIANEKEKDV